MTPEEFEFEVLTDVQYARKMANKPFLTTDHDTWREDAQRELAKILEEEAKAKAKQQETEPVDPEEVF